MAEVLSEAKIEGTPGRMKYPWDQWLDGRKWLLKRGEDFVTTIRGMRQRAYVEAWKRGLKVAVCQLEGECKLQGGGLTIQAYRA